MGQLGDLIVGGVDDENSTVYPDEPVFTWKQDTNGDYYLCENSEYIIRPLNCCSPDCPMFRVVSTCRSINFDTLDEAKEYVEGRVRAEI